MQKMFAVVDCNNFFVSCERAFNPSLENKPVIVLSNNDGCIVSRSNEAKALGIPMGVPLFKIKELVVEQQVAVISSNFELYADMSSRIMQTLEELSPTVEYYSIDEAFIPLSLYSSQDYDTWAEKVRDTIMQYTGIPVSIGIAPSRTLAKAANEFAKKWEICNGVFSFVGMSEEKVAYYLQQLPVEAVWGIGYKSARTLQAAAIYTAHDLTQTCESTIRKYLKIMGVRTRAELLGTSCITLSENRAPKKGILSSRSFGKKVMKLEELGEAVASYIDTACHKLRKQDCVARILTIYIRSSLYSKTQAYYSKSMTLALPIASNYTAIFITHGLSMLKKIFKPGVTYAKAGVFLSEISPQTAVQQHLFLTQENSKIPLRQNISNAIDSVRKRYGEKSIGFAAAGIEKKWQGKNEQRTPRYTTQITELLFAS